MKTNSKIIKGGVYLTIVNVLSQFLAIIVNIVLARLLMPEDFGLLALTMTFMGFITLFTSLGFGASIIHNRESTQEQLSSLYWLNTSLAVASVVIIYISAPFAANFYNDIRLSFLIRVASLNIVITPIFIIHYKILERDLEFKSISKINLTGTLVGSIAAIIAALSGLGVYALILQPLIGTIVRLILVLIISKWKPQLCFKYNQIKGMVWYSLKFKGSNTALYFERNIDYLILGKFFTSTILGHYAFAYNIMYTPVKRISYIFSEVLFPSFSSFQKDKQKILTGYFKSVTLIAMISIPGMTLLAFNADLIIQTIFGHKWDGAVPIVRILCFAGAIQSISQFGDVIFSSIGKPEISMYVTIGRTILTILAIVIGVQYGVLWVAYLLVITKALSYMLFLVVLNTQISFSLLHLFSSLKGPLVSLITLSVVYVLHHYKYYNVNSLTLLATMLIIILSLTYLFHKKIIGDIINVLKEKTQ